MSYATFQMSKEQFEAIRRTVIKSRIAKYVKQYGTVPSQEMINTFEVTPQDIARLGKIFYVDSVVDGLPDLPDEQRERIIESATTIVNTGSSTGSTGGGGWTIVTGSTSGSTSGTTGPQGYTGSTSGSTTGSTSGSTSGSTTGSQGTLGPQGSTSGSTGNSSTSGSTTGSQGTLGPQGSTSGTTSGGTNP